MRRVHPFTVRLLVAIVLPAPFLSGVAECADRDKDALMRAFSRLERGMTPELVRQRVGNPKHIARQIFYHRYREQWIYDAPISVRLTFDCPRGQKPQLLSPPEVSGKAEPRP
jgi:hypothetical protein